MLSSVPSSPTGHTTIHYDNYHGNIPSTSLLLRCFNTSIVPFCYDNTCNVLNDNISYKILMHCNIESVMSTSVYIDVTFTGLSCIQ